MLLIFERSLSAAASASDSIVTICILLVHTGPMLIIEDRLALLYVFDLKIESAARLGLGFYNFRTLS